MGATEIGELTRELYLVPPARFTAVRDELVRQARAAGHRGLATQLRGLRRPTRSAWLVNLLSKHERDTMERLCGLGRDFRHAQTRLDAAELRRLSSQRQQLIADLLRRARRRAAEEGLPVSNDVLLEVERTLYAALVDLGASATVLSGHLTRPIAHSGFGPMPHVAPVRTAAAGEAPTTASDAGVSAESAGQASHAERDAASGATPAGEADADTWEAGWSFWPVEGGQVSTTATAHLPGDARGSGGTAEPSDAGEPSQDRARMRLVPGGRTRAEAPTPQDAVHQAEGELASAESAHWRSEFEVADAEGAVEAATDRLTWLDEQRFEARRDKAGAEQRLADARLAQQAAVRRIEAARRALEAAEGRRLPAHGPPPAPEDD
jgi:hypothetical protein